MYERLFKNLGEIIGIFYLISNYEIILGSKITYENGFNLEHGLCKDGDMGNDYTYNIVSILTPSKIFLEFRQGSVVV